MSDMQMQQIIISGVGGQGVLFVTKLMAETALDLGYSILISETHGMAQRGGNVISHLKVGSHESLISPLIRPGRADVLIALHPDALAVHGYYLAPGGKAFVNTPETLTTGALDASRIAADLGSPVSANLVLLGFAAGANGLFCNPDDLESAIRGLGGKRLEAGLNAFRAGRREAKQRS